MVSVGEQITISKLCMCLEKLGYQAISYTGWQVPIITNSIFGNARIESINTEKIKRDLEKGKIVVVAGFGKEEKQDELKRLNVKIERLRSEKNRGDELRAKRDTFAEITPEQKDLIEEYFDMVDECKEKGKDVDADIEKYNQIKEVSYHYSYGRKKSEEERNKWQRALDGLIEDGEASEELLDAIDTIISEENVGYKKYSEGKDRYAMQRDGYSERFTSLVAWYLETRRERIVTKILHRKEEAYKALTVEHKKLCEMAGLVEEAERLEDSLDDKKGVDGHEGHDDE